MRHSLFDILKRKAAVWEKDRTVNPIHARIEIQSVWKPEGLPVSVTFDVRMSYSPVIRALFIPLYIVSSMMVHSGLFDYIEDVAYFKSFTRRGIERKYAELARTRERVDALIDEAILEFERESVDGSGSALS